MLAQFNSLPALFQAFPDDGTALRHFETIYWKHGAFCPYCRDKRVMRFSDGKTFKCGACRKRFSLKTGTIFEDTKLGMHVWFAAIWLLLNHPKGVASTQLAKDLNITQKSAWFVLHRLRYASKTRSFHRPLAGTVEADESVFGGKESNKPKRKRKQRQFNTKGKTIVIGMVERGGDVRTKVIPDLKGANVQAEVRANVLPGTVLMTDESNAYYKLRHDYDLQRVNHTKDEYVRGNVHVNTVEGMWSLFKRQYHGTHHWISPWHLQAYVDEMCYRYNRREMHKSESVDDLLGRVAGRLTYKALVDGQAAA